MHQPLEVIDTRDLIFEMRTELLRVLRNLDSAAWDQPTTLPGWSVKDVALHLLGNDIGSLSRHRDKDGMTFEEDSFEALVARINQSNAEWITAARRMSKRMLLTLLKTTGDELQDYLSLIDLEEEAGKVDWAGDDDAPMVLQIAREYTEYWTHHQHICEAVGERSLKDRRFMHAVFDVFVHALPRTYAHLDTPDGTLVRLRITGEGGDDWDVLREDGQWRLYRLVEAEPDAMVSMRSDVAWRLFTKGIARQHAAEQTTITGDVTLGAALLDAVAILA